jgi:hypothetical protein
VTLVEARAECERWFRSLKWDEDKAIALGRLAAARRAGTATDEDARRELSKWGRSPTVFDGAKLEQAVRVLLKHAK